MIEKITKYGKIIKLKWTVENEIDLSLDELPGDFLDELGDFVIENADIWLYNDGINIAPQYLERDDQVRIVDLMELMRNGDFNDPDFISYWTRKLAECQQFLKDRKLKLR